MYPWCAEIEVLLACARPRMLDADAERAARAVARGIDGARLAALARAHGLSPLLHLHAGRGSVVLPADARDPIDERAAVVARRSLRLSAALLAVLRALDDAHIGAVPLKGPVLAMSVYGAVALRDFGDLDVLVAERDLSRAAATLIAHGYQPASPMPGDLPALVESRQHHISLRSPAGNVVIELHGAMLSTLSGRRYGLERVAPMLAESSFMGAPIRVMRPGAAFAYLTQHGGLHAWSRLEWLATMAAMRPSSQDARSDAAMLLNAIDGGRRADAALDLAATLIDGPPERVMGAASQIVIARLVREPGRAMASSREEFQYQLRTDAGFLLRARRVWTALAAPQAVDLEAARLPRWLTPALFIARPVRLAWRRLRSAPRGPRPRAS